MTGIKWDTPFQEMPFNELPRSSKTWGEAYTNWRSHQSSETWGTLSFDEWLNSGNNQQAVHWSDFVARRNKALEKGR